MIVKEAKQALDNMKYEIANELGVNYSGDLGNLTSRQNGYVGGNMVKRMIQQYESQISGGNNQQ